MYKCFFKRLIDFIIALCTLAFIWPILLLITIWLHFANKGAGAFFTQERPGKDGRIFRVIKFKSMTDERDAEGKLLPDAKRLTHVGKFVRATSIDELPQLINVLKGDMALIGPRPLLPEYLPLYSKEQARRHEVRPGITGWAQVNGRNAITVLNSDGVLLSIDKTPNVKLINLHAFKWCIDSSKKVQYSNSGFFSNIKQYLGKFLFYISTNKWFYLYLKVKNLLTFEQKYDLLISIGLPFAIHWAVAHKIAGRNIADCYVADYGDPFSKFNIATKVAPYFQFIEKKCINRFDFISIPTDIAINSYRWLKDDDHIKVIPQGFNFNGIKLSTYTPNSVPTFAFAGLFYSDIRNPQIFLDFLSDFTLDFRFVIYTNINVQDSMKCLRPYIDKLDRRMLIIDSIPRDKLILELSKMVFLHPIVSAMVK